MGRGEEGGEIFIDNTHFEICAFKNWCEYLKRGGGKFIIDNIHFEICTFENWCEYLKRGREGGRFY